MTDADPGYSDTPKLRSPRLSVILTDRSEPIVVQTITPDLIRYEETAARQKPPWPIGLDVMGMRGLTFVAWAALRRLKEIAADWDDFVGTGGRPALLIEVSDPPPIEGDSYSDPDPTRPDLEVD